MTTANQRPRLYDVLLQALFAVGILTFAIGAFGMFFYASSAALLRLSGSWAIYGLVTAVGIKLIQRWHRVGLGICLLACISPCVAQGFARSYWAVIGGVLLLIALPLFVAKARPSGTIIWRNMVNGMGLKHSRHIYQLTTVLVLAIASVMAFYHPEAAQEPEPVIPARQEEKPTRDITLALLDSANVTLDEVVVLEDAIDNVAPEQQQQYSKRIFALKHILVSGLMTNSHNPQNILNICTIHNGEYSPEQQRILNWYASLPDYDQAAWIDCPSVDNLAAFESEVKQRITPHQQ